MSSLSNLISTKNTLLDGEFPTAKKLKLESVVGGQKSQHYSTNLNLLNTTNTLLSSNNASSHVTQSYTGYTNLKTSHYSERSKYLSRPTDFAIGPTLLATENRILLQGCRFGEVRYFDKQSIQLKDDIRKASEKLQSISVSTLQSAGSLQNFEDGEQNELTDGKKPRSETCSDVQLFGMPVYYFPSLELSEQEEKKIFSSLSEDQVFLYRQRLEAEKSIKASFLTTVSTSLMHTPNFENASDRIRMILIDHAKTIAEFDPEFILKTSLYTRQELHIRKTANFLLAYAAYNEKTRIYLQKYFGNSIRLPTDWIDVAELYQMFSDSGLNPGSLPAALRRVMKETFRQFDKYQLAKYNKQKHKKDKKSKEETKPSECSEKANDDAHNEEDEIILDIDDDEKVTEKKVFSLKRLIRLLHISKPVEHVMPLLGKKYPNDPESFRTSGLPGMWEESQAGKRMKLPVPETWETQLSLRGNKAHVWQELIDNKKLPYMAMLRNLRNLLTAGISSKHHQTVISILSNEARVIKSRQFPFRFFSAYQVLNDLRKLKEEGIPSKQRSGKNKTPYWQIKQKEKMLEKLENFELLQLDKYKKAIDKAIEISALHNLQPIPGRTLIICDYESCYTKSCNLVKHAFQNSDKLSHGALLLGVMCLSVCENGELMLFPNANRSTSLIELKEKSILKNVQQIFEEHCSHCPLYGDGSRILGRFLEKQIDSAELKANEEHLNTLIFLTNGEAFSGGDGPEELRKFLRKYRALINPDLLFVQVDLAGSQNKFDDIFTSENDVLLSGFSDQLLKFVAERGSGAQVNYVENIDEKYELKPLPKHVSKHLEKKTHSIAPLALIPKIPKWQTVRIFVSSTFRDMHGERDILARYVFPALRSRASAFHINIYEVDLRWGITEKEATDESLLAICLSEVIRCQLFIGILGNRYGATPSQYVVPDNPEFDWVREYPPGASLTEMEIQCAALNHLDESKDRAFFYFRDSAFERDIPQKWKDDFCSESDEHGRKVNDLKQRIRSSGLHLFDGYPCKWGGEVNGVPTVDDLHEFGQQVLEDLWKALQNLYINVEEDEAKDDPYLEHLAFANGCENFVGHNDLVNKLLKSIGDKNGLHIIEGKPGSGKTTLMAHLSQKLEDATFMYFVGLVPGSASLFDLLFHLIARLCERYMLHYDIPLQKECLKFQLGDVLHDAVRRSPEGKVIILIDGLDNLTEEPFEQVEWIPHNLPSGVRIVCSVTQNSDTAQQLLKRGNSVVHKYSLGSLRTSERRSLISLQLVAYSKALDTDPFNNQFSILSTKRDAGIPLYLHLACEELRTFGIMEQLTKKVQNLPQSIPLLLQGALTSIEKEHGVEVTQHTLCILALSKEGLGEHELHSVLNEVLNTSKDDAAMDEDKPVVPIVRFVRLLQSLRLFLQANEVKNNKIFLLAHQEMMKAVVLRYFSSSKDRKNHTLYHQALADYFYKDIDPYENCSWQGAKNARSFRSLLYHLLKGHLHTELLHVLCDLNFMESALHVGIGFYVLDVFRSMLRYIEDTKSKVTYRCSSRKRNQVVCKWFPRLWSPVDNKQDCFEFFQFLLRNIDILQSTPSLIWQQAKLQTDSQQISRDASLLNEYCGFELVTDANGCSPIWKLSKFAKPICCLALSRNETLCALGGQDGVVRLVDANTSKLLKTFIGHCGPVTKVVFVGHNMLCSASKDGTLITWSIYEGNRIAVLKGHTRPVSCCCCDAEGNTLVSGSWDRTIRIWNPKDGRQISCISKNSCPINCMAFHPTKQVVVIGGWDKRVKLWDLQSLKRIAALKGHNASVRSVAITSCGNVIISASANGEVMLWSTTSGVRIGLLKGHAAAVNCVSMAPRGFYFATASDDLTTKMWVFNQVPSQPIKNEKLLKNANYVAFVTSSKLAIAEKDVIQMVNIRNNRVMLTKQLDNAEITCMTGVRFTSPFVNIIGAAYGTFDGTVEVVTSSSSDLHCGKIIDSLGDPITVLKNISNWVIAGTYSGELCVINLINSRETARARAHRGSVMLCSNAGHIPESLSAKEVEFITAGEDQRLQMWKILEIVTEGNVSLTKIADFPTGHTDTITACAASVPHNILVTAAKDTTVILWNVNHEGKGKMLDGLDAPIIDIAVEEKMILGGAEDGSIRIWTHTGSKVATFARDELYNQYCSIAFTFFGNEDSLYKYGSEAYALVATLDKYGLLAIRKPFKCEEVGNFKGHARSVTSCELSANYLLSSSLDNSVCLWKTAGIKDAGSKQTVQNKIQHHSGKITCLDAAAGPEMILSADDEGTINVWKCSDGQLELCQSLEGYGIVRSAQFVSEDGQQILVGYMSDHQGTICMLKNCRNEEDSSASNWNFHLCKKRVFDAGEIACLVQCRQPKNSILACFTSKFMTILTTEFVTLYAVTQAEQTSVSKDWLMCTAFYPGDPQKFLAAYADGSIQTFKHVKRSWEVSLKADETDSSNLRDHFNNKSKLHVPTSLVAAEFGEDNWFFIGDSDGYLTVKKGDVFESKKIHNEAIINVAKVGELLFTLSKDQTIKVWEIPALKQIGLLPCDDVIISMTCSRWNVNTDDAPETLPVYLVLGTGSGEIQILKWINSLNNY